MENNELYFCAENFGDRKIVESGTAFGLNWWIISMGTHPCCYVQIPKENKLYKVHYMNYDEETDINVHGGITFSENHLIDVDELGINWYIGWDYAHAGDYIYIPMCEKHNKDTKKYTVEELKQDIFEACKQIKEK